MKETSRTLVTIFAGIGMFIGSLMGQMVLDGGSLLLSTSIKNKEQLENMLEEESSKLGLGHEKISVRFGNAKGGVAHYENNPDGSFDIVLGSLGRNRSALKHELYHIYAEDYKYESSPGYIRYLRHSRAILYQSLGIK